MIYVQSDNERSQPHHFDAACAMFGAIDTNKKYRLTSFEEVISGKFDYMIKSNLFVGSVEFMYEVFNRVGIQDTGFNLLPDRPFDKMTIESVRELINSTGKARFVKSVKTKVFSGSVIEKPWVNILNSVSSDTEVMVYEPFDEDILSEWRVYIHMDDMIDSRSYSGDFTIAPDYRLVLDNISRIKHELGHNTPIAYTIDVAVIGTTETRKTEVVEMNDMVAIGNYGLQNDRYLRMLTDRYFQIMQQKR